MSTPGVKISYQEHSDDAPLPLNLHTPFRGSAARANYLSADRIDAQNPCKEVCRLMAGPIAQSLTALKRPLPHRQATLSIFLPATGVKRHRRVRRHGLGRVCPHP